jgi:serine/threonine protein kinase
MIIQFEESFCQNGRYKNFYEEREKLGAGSFGEVFRAQRLFKSSESFCTIKKITFKSENKKTF